MKNTYNKIAIYGKMGSGKDFVGKYIINNYGYTRYAFADEVRKLTKEYFPHLYGEDGKKNRWLLREVATMFRSIEKDVWVNRLLSNIKEKHDWLKQYGYQDESIIITDCRFPNEYQKLKEEGYIFIKVETDDDIRESRMITRKDIFDNKNISHESESFYDQFTPDYILENNETPEDLYKKINDVMKDLLARK